MERRIILESVGKLTVVRCNLGTGELLGGCIVIIDEDSLKSRKLRWLEIMSVDPLSMYLFAAPCLPGFFNKFLP